MALQLWVSVGVCRMQGPSLGLPPDHSDVVNAYRLQLLRVSPHACPSQRPPRRTVVAEYFPAIMCLPRMDEYLCGSSLMFERPN